MIEMDTIGKFEYPTETNFSETLEVANEALNRFGGFMSNLQVTQKLGYNYKDGKGISGWVYKRFDEMCLFGLFVRERGGIRTTDLAKDAFDPYDATKAAQARIQAISKIPLFAKAIADWKGLIPDQEKFPAKLKELASVDWVEARKHSDVLEKIISDCFSYVKPSFEIKTATTAGAPLLTTSDVGLVPMSSMEREVTQVAETGSVAYGKPFGELRTVVGTVIVKNAATLKLARNLLDVIEGEIKETEAAQKKAPRIAAKEADKKEEKQ
jgi:hypothetical protein